MKIWSDSIPADAPIPAAFALGKYHPETHVTFSENLSPHIGFSDLPKGTLSLVILCEDQDVPTRPDDVNQPGRTVPADLPRAGFMHWVMVDISPDIGELPEGAYCQGVTAHGKDGVHSPGGPRVGLNDYTGWFAGDDTMAGDYYGYDGPCPPWNDERIHHYTFTLFAIDCSRLPVEGRFTAGDVRAAMAGHILDQASFTSSYHIYPAARDMR